MSKKPPTFFDEVMKHVPTDRWITYSEMKYKMHPRGINMRYLKTCLCRGVERGYLISRDTGIRKAYKYDAIFPVYEYMRVVSGRAVTKVPHNARQYMTYKIREGKAKRNGQCKTDPRPTRWNRPAWSKLDDTKAREIRILYAAGSASMAEIGRMYGVTLKTVFRVVHRQSYRHVKD